MTSANLCKIAALSIESQAIVVEVEAMKAANKSRESINYPLAYGEECFQSASDDLRQISEDIMELTKDV